MEDPIEKFESWWKAAVLETPLKQKSAVCVSTVGRDGFPSGRFVDLKAVDADGFTFCTYLDSEKGRHLAANPKVALTIWWDHVGYQVRVKGVAETIPADEALAHWAARSRSAQLTTLCSKQSRVLESAEDLQQQLRDAEVQYRGVDVPKPATWGGYQVRPVSIEFLTFSDTRLHKRELFERDETGRWRVTLLQP